MEPLPTRRRRRRAALALLLLAVACHGAAAAPQLTQQQASAHPAGGGPLLYREQHLLRSEDGRPRERLVLYRCPGGAAFARKRIDYAAAAQAPDFELVDARSGFREGMRRRGGRVELHFTARRGAAEARALLAAAPEVADAGFDEFIRAHWRPLLAGEALRMRFAVPSRLRTMEFAVRRAGSTQLAGEPAVRFRLRLEGLLGLVAPHIDVDYGLHSRRLLRFEGLGNLRDARAGRPLAVRIDFPAPAQPAPAQAWGAALSEPLAGRCESGQRADTSTPRTPPARV